MDLVYKLGEFIVWLCLQEGLKKKFYLGNKEVFDEVDSVELLRGIILEFYRIQ